MWLHLMRWSFKPAAEVGRWRRRLERSMLPRSTMSSSDGSPNWAATTPMHVDPRCRWFLAFSRTHPWRPPGCPHTARRVCELEFRHSEPPVEPDQDRVERGATEERLGGIRCVAGQEGNSVSRTHAVRRQPPAILPTRSRRGGSMRPGRSSAAGGRDRPGLGLGRWIAHLARRGEGATDDEGAASGAPRCEPGEGAQPGDRGAFGGRD